MVIICSQLSKASVGAIALSLLAGQTEGLEPSPGQRQYWLNPLRESLDYSEASFIEQFTFLAINERKNIFSSCQ